MGGPGFHRLVSLIGTRIIGAAGLRSRRNERRPGRYVRSVSALPFALLYVASCSSRPGDTRFEPPADQRFTVQRSRDDLTLTVHFVGGAPFAPGDPCSVDYHAEAKESATEVAIRIVAFAPPAPSQKNGPTGCADLGYGRTVEVPLAAPLRGRQVVNARSGVAQQIIGPDEFLGPTTATFPTTTVG